MDPPNHAPTHPPDTCLDGYYLSDYRKGRGKGREKTKGTATTLWGEHGERERDKCVVDEEGNGNACCEAPEGTVAVMPATVQSLTIEEGWYRNDPNSAQVLPCRYPFECAGFVNTSNVTGGETGCFEGYAQALCR